MDSQLNAHQDGQAILSLFNASSSIGLTARRLNTVGHTYVKIDGMENVVGLGQILALKRISPQQLITVYGTDQGYSKPAQVDCYWKLGHFTSSYVNAKARLKKLARILGKNLQVYSELPSVDFPASDEKTETDDLLTVNLIGKNTKFFRFSFTVNT